MLHLWGDLFWTVGSRSTELGLMDVQVVLCGSRSSRLRFFGVIREIFWMVQDGSNPFFQVVCHPEQFRISPLKSFVLSQVFDVNLVHLIRQFLPEPRFKLGTVLRFLIATQSRHRGIDFARCERLVPFFDYNLDYFQDRMFVHAHEMKEEVMEIMSRFGFDEDGVMRDWRRRKQTLLRMIHLSNSSIVRDCFDSKILKRSSFPFPTPVAAVGYGSLTFALLSSGHQKPAVPIFFAVFSAVLLGWEAVRSRKK